MKYLLLLLITLAAMITAEDDWSPIMNETTFLQMHKDCATQSGITKEQEEKIRQIEHADEKEVRDYILCAVKRVGIFNEDTGYNVDRIMAQLEQLVADTEDAREIIKECADNNSQKSPADQWAYRGVKCMRERKIDKMMREGEEKRENEIEQEA